MRTDPGRRDPDGKGGTGVSEPLICLENCSYTYEDDEKPAVRKVSLTVGEGEFAAVLGRNGSGKSTMAKLVNALYVPTEGTVTVCGIDSSQEDRRWEIRRCAGMVFQNPDNQIVATIVEEDVAFGPENLGVPQPEIRRRVDEALRMVGMEAYAKQAPHKLSGGQKQRVAIAGMLAMRPKILVFDEATAMLDPVGRREILETALRLNREEGMTILWITHFMEEAVFANRLIVMHEGSVAMDGSPREVFAQAQRVRELGLDLPAVTGLWKDLEREGGAPEGTPLTQDELVEALCRLLSKT